MREAIRGVTSARDLGAAVARRRIGAWLVVLIGSCLVLAPLVWPELVTPAKVAEVVARVNGDAITTAELHAAVALALEQHERNRRRCQIDADRARDDVMQLALQDLVRARLRALETERTGETIEAFVARIRTAAAVTDREVEAYYVGNRAQIPYPLAEVAPQIRAYLEGEAASAAQDAAYRELERRFVVKRLLEPLRYKVAADGFAAYGPADAPVTIVEFSDFECPYCARLLPALEQAKRQYAGKLRVVYRHYPLTGIHPNAWKAAEAALCAGEQGRFWELHDLMFAEQEALTVADLKAKAARLELNGEAFNQCLDSSRHHDAVLADVRAGDAAGVSGTPAMFVNGAVPFAKLAAIIDDELIRAAAATSGALDRGPPRRSSARPGANRRPG